MVENHIQLKPVISNVEPSGSATRQLQQLAITVYVTVQDVKYQTVALYYSNSK